MAKLKALLAGLIPIIVVVLGGIYFYSNFPTTPALILLLLFAFSAVLLGITFYNNVLENEETKHIPYFEWKNIEIEGNLLPIFPDEFFANPQISDGMLWSLDEVVTDEILRYQSGNINKLKNESVFEFSKGYSIVVKDLHLVHVGDFQFSACSFDTMDIKKNNQVIQSIGKKGNILTVTKNGEVQSYKVDTNAPVFVFALNEEF
jgi:hypothetical protein